MRLEQILFSQGFGTRHECRGLIALGQIAVKGEVVDDPDADIDVESLDFTVKGETWPYREKALLMMNKPAGYECSQSRFTIRASCSCYRLRCAAAVYSRWEG